MHISNVKPHATGSLQIPSLRIVFWVFKNERCLHLIPRLQTGVSTLKFGVSLKLEV
jgi:hypothetical protein